MLKPRKRLVKAKLKEDKLLIYTAKVQGFISRYQRQLIYGLAAVVVIGGVVITTLWSKANAQKQAAFEGLLARDAYMRSELDEAITRSDMILEDYTGTRAAALALMLKGRVYEQRGELDEAARAFQEVIDDYAAQSYFAFGAYYALGSIHYGRGEYVEAARFYREAAEHYPDHFNAPVSLVEAGHCLKKARRYEQAGRIFRRVMTEYPRSRSVDKARKDLEEIEFMP